MAWTRIDDRFYKNPKIKDAGPIAAHVYIAGLVYCNTFLTDGFIKHNQLAGITGDAFDGRKHVKRLVDVGLWDEVEGGYQVHDYLDYNRSKEQIEQINEKRRVSGKQGGRPRIANETEDSEKQIANQNAKQIAKQIDNQIGFENETNLASKTKPLIPLYPNHSLKNEFNPPPPDAHTQAFIFYEQEIGRLTQSVSEKVKAAVDEYSEEWVVAAIGEAALNNARNWRYTEAILRRWKVDGFKKDTRIKTEKPAYRRNGTKVEKPINRRKYIEGKYGSLIEH